MMKPYKIRVPNERVHVLIQEKLFRLGFTWAEGQKTVLNDLAKNNYILTASTNIFYSPYIERYFKTSDSKEISYQDFLNLPEFDVNNCKIKLSFTDFEEALEFSRKLLNLNITVYGRARTIVRALSGQVILRPRVQDIPPFMFIRNGQSVMVGTE